MAKAPSPGPGRVVPSAEVLVTGRMEVRRRLFARRPQGTADWLFIYMEGGVASFGHAGGRFVARQRDCVLIRPGVPHDYGLLEARGYWKNTWVHFLPRPECLSWMRWPEFAPGMMWVHFRVEGIEGMSFGDGCAEVVICNSVLHFARDEGHWERMVRELWRVLRPGGMLFCRLGSTIGKDFERVGASTRKFLLPGGVEWFLVDEEMLMGWTKRLGGELVDPLKTTVVQGSRCMTTWVVRKRR